MEQPEQRDWKRSREGGLSHASMPMHHPACSSLVLGLEDDFASACVGDHHRTALRERGVCVRRGNGRQQSSCVESSQMCPGVQVTLWSTTSRECCRTTARGTNGAASRSFCLLCTSRSPPIRAHPPTRPRTLGGVAMRYVKTAWASPAHV